MTNGQSGIEISPGISDAQKKTAEVLHTLHLEWFSKLVAAATKHTTMTITVDGVTREDPWHATHFVACEPGEHALELRWNTHGIGGGSLAPLRQTITVEPGRVTELVYTIQTSLSHGLPAASLEVKGTREA